MLKEFCGYDEKKYDLYHNEKKEKIKKLAIDSAIWVASLVAVIMLAFFIIHFGIKKTSVVNSSMEPTLDRGDDIIINCLAYKLTDPDRFDVCVIESGDDEHSVYDIKRVYGLPGETIQISNNRIYINGEEITDEVKADDMELAGIASEPVELGEDEYFVLADNRNGSEDSRYSSYGLVKKDELVGKAWLRTNRFGIVNMLNKKN